MNNKKQKKEQNMDKDLYFDSASTTYPTKEVLEVAFHAPWENPSTINTFGVESRKRVEDVRRQIQRLLRCEDAEVIFTSGGTESNNTAIFSALGVLDGRKRRMGSPSLIECVCPVFDPMPQQGGVEDDPYLSSINQHVFCSEDTGACGLPEEFAQEMLAEEARLFRGAGVENTGKEVMSATGSTANNVVGTSSVQSGLPYSFSADKEDLENSSIENEKQRVYITGLEHSSVYDCLYFLEKKLGFLEIIELPVDTQGRAILTDVDFSGALVCVSHVNNELGTVTDIAAIRRMIDSLPADRQPLLLVDGVQALGKIELERVVEAVRLSDYYSISGHKIHGLKGTGALLAHAPVVPLHIGGGQEQSLRAGTENTVGIAALGEALRLLEESQQFIKTQNAEFLQRQREQKQNVQFIDKNNDNTVGYNNSLNIGAGDFSSLDLPDSLDGRHQNSLPISNEEQNPERRVTSVLEARAYLLATLAAALPTEDWIINSPAEGSPYIVSISIKGVKSEVLIHMIADKRISLSSGSACSSHKDTLSRMIKKISCPKAYADGTIRISFAPDYFYEQPNRRITFGDLKCLAGSIAESALKIQKYNRK